MEKIAVIQTGGKQYVVTEGDVLSVEKIAADARKGSTVSFPDVLLVDDGSEVMLGAPTVKGKSVTAEVIEDGRAQKVVVIRYRAKSRHFKKNGHRQPFTKVKITSIA